jgi:hypothetical protein
MGICKPWVRAADEFGFMLVWLSTKKHSLNYMDFVDQDVKDNEHHLNLRLTRINFEETEGDEISRRIGDPMFY